MTVKAGDRSVTPRSGYVALLGWTNVGKSTLLNRLVGIKLAAVADVAQTTRHRILGVCNRGGGQLVFVDTPGIHRPKHRMNQTMVDNARRTIRDVDLCALVVDASRGIGAGDREVASLLSKAEAERVLVLNKIDLMRDKTRLLPMIQEGVTELGFADVVPVSALTGDGTEALLDLLLSRLPEGGALFPDDYLTDQPERVIAAEWIREAILSETREELPHATAVVIDRWTEREDGLIEMEATILVDRESQKRIVIGKEGSLLKRIGSAARRELEGFLGKRIFLKTWVQVRQDWRNDGGTLRRLGLE